MTNKEFAEKLGKRTREFAVQVIRLSSELPKTSEGQVVRTQLTKSGTSIGANYREANRARSKKDFINKMRICEGECSETQYWLEIIADTEMLPKNNVNHIYDECSEILAIFVSAVTSLSK